jgi:hypothetical protein
MVVQLLQQHEAFFSLDFSALCVVVVVPGTLLHLASHTSSSFVVHVVHQLMLVL